MAALCEIGDIEIDVVLYCGANFHMTLKKYNFVQKFVWEEATLIFGMNVTLGVSDKFELIRSIQINEAEQTNNKRLPSNDEMRRKKLR